MHHGASRCIAVHFSRYPTSELEKLSTISELEKLSTSELEKLSTPNLEKILEKLPTPEHEKLSTHETEKLAELELEKVSTPELENLSTNELEKLSIPDLEKILEKLSTPENGHEDSSINLVSFFMFRYLIFSFFFEGNRGNLNHFLQMCSTNTQVLLIFN